MHALRFGFRLLPLFALLVTEQAEGQTEQAEGQNDDTSQDDHADGDHDGSPVSSQPTRA